MKTGKSKSQVPSSKESPSAKLQGRGSVSYLDRVLDAGVMELKDEQAASSANGHPYDLEERTALFGEEIVRFAKTIPRDPGNDRLINQVVGAGTSVGANYCEASESVSKKDFLNIIGRCAKEAKETRFFLRMIAAAEPPLVVPARKLYREANELLLIFSSMRRKK